MKIILLFGAGKSATALIKYLNRESQKQDWHIILVDQNREEAEKKAGNSEKIKVLSFDMQEEAVRKQNIAAADLVISLLPAHLHLIVAQDCIFFKKHLLTASYLSDDISRLKAEIEKAGILFMGEMGLDPGIDHMSAMKALHRIKEAGGNITAFESFCGALVSPQSDDNPWHYKISWSPQSLISAGKEGAVYRKEGLKYVIPYRTLFGNYGMINIPGFGHLAYYPNRNSQRYARLYQLEEVPTVLRATLRHPDFCKGWQTVVDLDLTDTTTPFQTNHLTYKGWVTRQIKKSEATKEQTEIWEKNSLLHQQFHFLGLTDDKIIDKGIQTAGEVLFDLISQKLALQPDDRDMIIMYHHITYEKQGHLKKAKSVLLTTGDNATDTAIAKTVGLPLGILTKLLLTDKIRLTGLHIPILKEIYLPILHELEQEGICFQEYGD